MPLKFNIYIIRNWAALILCILCLVLNNSEVSNFLVLGNLFFLSLMSVGSLKKFVLIKGGVTAFILLPFFIGIITQVEINQIIRFLALLLLFLTYPIPVRFSKMQYLILGIVIIYLLVMQIGCALQIPLFYDFRAENYPPEQNLWGDNVVEGIEAFLGGLKDIRLPGIYYNPNIMGQSLVIVYGFIFIYLFDKIKNGYYYPLFLIFFFSILFTGSRTSMAAFLVMNSFKFWPILKKNPKLFTFFIGAVLALVLYYGVTFDFRGLDITGGVFREEGSESGNIKLTIFLSYFEDLNYLSFFDFAGFMLGHLNWDRQFDADIGYLLSYFGVIGFCVIVFYFILIFKLTIPKYRFIFSLFLISIGATLIMNFRFSILFFMLLGMVASERKIVFK